MNDGHRALILLLVTLLAGGGTYLLYPAEPLARAAGQPAAGPLPTVELPDTQGNQRSLARLTAGRRSLVYVYSGCCGHCTKLLPRLVPLARRAEAAGRAVVGIEFMGTPESCAESQRTRSLPGTLLGDADGAVCGRLRIGDFTLLVLDDQGRVVHRGLFEGAAAKLGLR